MHQWRCYFVVHLLILTLIPDEYYGTCYYSKITQAPSHSPRTLFTSPVLANLKYFQYRSCTCFRQMQGYWPDSMTWMASLTLNIFHTFFYCFCYWLYISRYLLEMLIDLNFQRHNISAPTYIFVHIHIFANTGWRHGRFLE